MAAELQRMNLLSSVTKEFKDKQTNLGSIPFILSMNLKHEASGFLKKLN